MTTTKIDVMPTTSEAIDSAGAIILTSLKKAWTDENGMAPMPTHVEMAAGAVLFLVCQAAKDLHTLAVKDSK